MPRLRVPAQIRPLIPEEVPQVTSFIFRRASRQLRLLAQREELDLWLEQHCSQEIVKAAMENTLGVFLVAEKEGLIKAVGYVELDRTRPDVAVIEANYYGRKCIGVAWRVLEAQSNWARRHGAKIVSISILDNNKQTKALLERFGFSLCAQTRDEEFRNHQRLQYELLIAA